MRETISQREQVRRKKQREQAPLLARMGVPLQQAPEITNDTSSGRASAGARARALDAHPPPALRRRSAQDTLTLIRKSELATALGVSAATITRWVAAGTFPKPIYVSDRSPARWRVVDVEGWLAKRQTARRKKPEPQGLLRNRNGSRGRSDP